MSKCKNCIYLCKEFRTADSEGIFQLNSEERQFDKKKINELIKNYTIRCYKGIWSSQKIEIDDVKKNINKLRFGSCFYFKYNILLNYKAVEELQEFKSNRSKTTKIIISITGVVITIFTLVLGIMSYKISKNQFFLSEKQLQPHFQVFNQFDYDNNKDLFTTDNLLVINKGNHYYMSSISSRCIIKIIEDDEKFIFPIEDYYNTTQKFSDEYDLKRFKIDNYEKLTEFLRFIENKEIFCDEVYTFVMIRYQDIQGNYNEEYFNSYTGELLNNNKNILDIKNSIKTMPEIYLFGNTNQENYEIIKKVIEKN